MKRTVWAAISAAVLLLAAGLACSNRTVSEGKKEAYQRWNHTRAQMLYAVGAEHLKVGELDRAGNKAQEALTLAPTHVEARILLGKVYIEKGHYAAAVRELARVVQQKPESAEAIYLLAVALEKDNRLEEALTNYRRAYAMDSRNVSALQAVAEVLVLMGRMEEAQQSVEGYLAETSENPGMFETAGRLAAIRGEHEKAAVYFRQALDLAPMNLSYLEALARAQFFAGRYSDAAGSLKDLTQRSGYTAPTWVYTMLGDCYMALDRPSNARDAYHVATERTPEEPGVWLNMAEAALKLDDAARAILASRQALDLDSQRLDAAIVLGYALIRGGQAKEAMEVLEAAAQKHPRNGMLQCLLGRAYEATGNKAEAKRRYALAAQLDPENQLAKELLSGPVAAGGGAG